MASTLETTFLRTTMTYRTPGGPNMTWLIHWLERWSVIPVFGNSRSLQHFVHLSDVAGGVFQALEISATIDRHINTAAGSSLSCKVLIRLAVQAFGSRAHCIHIPAIPTISALQVIKRFGLALGIKTEQVLLLNEDKVFSNAEAAEPFGCTLMVFEQGTRQEVAFFRSRADGLSV